MVQPIHAPMPIISYEFYEDNTPVSDALSPKTPSHSGKKSVATYRMAMATQTRNVAPSVILILMKV